MKAVVCSNAKLRVRDRPEPVPATRVSSRSCAAVSAAPICMSAVLVGFGAPFIALAMLVYRATATPLSRAMRLGLACGIAALGIAPSYDAYGRPLPIYVRLLRGEPVNFAAAAFALVVTWVTFIILTRLFGRRQRAYA